MYFAVEFNFNLYLFLVKYSNFYVILGSSLLLVNSSDSSDCEENEPPRFHHHHQEIQHRLQQQQQQQQLAVTKPPPRPHSGSRPHSTERPHDPFSNNSVAGSDVVDELLKPLQSYFSVFRTGVYDQGGADADLINGVRDGGPPAHNTRSQTDKRYKIKKNQSSANMGNEPRKARHDIVENGIGGLHHQQGPPPMKGVMPGGGQQVIHTLANQILPSPVVVSLPGHPGMSGGHPGSNMSAPPSGAHATVIIPGHNGPMMATPGLPSPGGAGGMQQPPPPVTNGFSQSMMEGMETELVAVSAGHSVPNLNEPPPSLLVEAGQYGAHTRPPAAAMMMMNHQIGAPPPSGVMMSPPGPSGATPRLPMFSTPTKEETLQAQHGQPQLRMPEQPQKLHIQSADTLHQLSDSQQKLTEQLEADISNLSIKDDGPIRQQVKLAFCFVL